METDSPNLLGNRFCARRLRCSFGAPPDYGEGKLQPFRESARARMRWIHFFISLAYITSPVVDMAVVMFVQQWIALSTPEQSFEAKLMMAELRAASFIVHSLGCAVGSGVWSSELSERLNWPLPTSRQSRYQLSNFQTEPLPTPNQNAPKEQRRSRAGNGRLKRVFLES